MRIIIMTLKNAFRHFRNFREWLKMFIKIE